MRYRPEFLEPALALHRSASAEFALGLSREREEADLNAIEHFYLRGGGEFLLGFLDDRLVAMGGYKRTSPDTAELRRMRVTPELQGLGHGKAVLRELEKCAREAGIRHLHVQAPLSRTFTLNFLRKYGYQETGRSHYGDVETVQFEKTLEG
jgi:GNAT superfamily N-acetyltransferase